MFENKNVEDALSLIKKNYSKAEPNIGFVLQLEELYTKNLNENLESETGIEKKIKIYIWLNLKFFVSRVLFLLSLYIVLLKYVIIYTFAVIMFINFEFEKKNIFLINDLVYLIIYNEKET